jgi:hypothetical protein
VVLLLQQGLGLLQGLGMVQHSLHSSGEIVPLAVFKFLFKAIG